MPAKRSNRPTRFKALAAHDQDCLIEFLKTLQVLPPGTESLVVDEKFRPRSWPTTSHVTPLS